MLAFVVVVGAICTLVADLGATILALDPIVSSPGVSQLCDAVCLQVDAGAAVAANQPPLTVDHAFVNIVVK